MKLVEYTVFEKRTGKVLQRGRMEEAHLEKYKTAETDWIEGRVEFEDTVIGGKVKKGKKPVRKEEAMPPPPPQEGISLGEFIQAVYWKEKGDPGPMAEWVRKMDEEMKNVAP